MNREEFEKACADCIEHIDSITSTPAPMAVKLGWMIFSQELADFLFEDKDEITIEKEV